MKNYIIGGLAVVGGIYLLSQLPSSTLGDKINEGIGIHHARSECADTITQDLLQRIKTNALTVKAEICEFFQKSSCNPSKEMIKQWLEVKVEQCVETR